MKKYKKCIIAFIKEWIGATAFAVLITFGFYFSEPAYVQNHRVLEKLFSLTLVFGGFSIMLTKRYLFSVIKSYRELKSD